VSHHHSPRTATHCGERIGEKWARNGRLIAAGEESRPHRARVAKHGFKRLCHYGAAVLRRGGEVELPRQQRHSVAAALVQLNERRFDGSCRRVAALEMLGEETSVDEDRVTAALQR
jgi:DNA-directed RNA polymerase subunit N (RpoN/RPB10)